MFSDLAEQRSPTRRNAFELMSYIIRMLELVTLNITIR